MDDYLNIYEYVGDKKQEYSTATNISKEEHEMLEIAPRIAHQKPQIKQSFTTTLSGNQVQEKNIKNVSKAKMKCFIFMAVIILAVTLLISLAAMVLSILSYNASSNSTGLKTQKANLSEILVQFDTYKLDVESMLKQINSTLLQQNSVQNATVSQLTMEQLRLDTYTLIDQLTDNISSLVINLNYTDNYIKSVAATTERNISQLVTQLDATNDNIMSVATTMKKNISQLSIQIDATNNDITSMVTTVKRSVSQLSTQFEAANNITMSVVTTVQRNVSQLFMELNAVNKFAISVQAEVIRIHCGAGEWHRVAILNMSDPSQQCPPAWREYNISQFRVCGRPVSMAASRPSHIYPINHWYSKVCGRVIGIQVSSPDAFLSNRGINDGYIDGVSITHGSPRNHIWSYVGSFSEIAENTDVCPCNYSSAVQSPSFVGNNYYCESGNPTDDWVGRVFPNDKLWDGEQCSHEGTCCTGANTPPWFSVSLGNPTSDDIEVRIMGTESTTNEDTPIELLEIYVQ